jgi:signal transduction histidine kinase
MGRLISDVLEFSTVGRNGGSPYWVSIEPLMDALSEEFAPRFAKVGVRMEIQRPLPQIMGDETRLRQVFSNLITNALRHLSGVKNPLIEVSAEAAERGHILCVADNGCGIPPELHNRVFDLFFSNTSSPEEKGTGLGLAIVKKAVEAFGGRVWVESKPDCGARFNIYLPETKT